MRGWFAIALLRRPPPITQHYLFPSATTRTLVVELGDDDLPSTTQLPQGRQRYNYLNQLKTYTKLDTEELLSNIEENGKTFALMPLRPESGMALNDDDNIRTYITFLRR